MAQDSYDHDQDISHDRIVTFNAAKTHLQAAAFIFSNKFPLYLRHHSFRPTKVQRMKETAKEEFGSEVPVACYDGCSLLGLNHRSLLISFLILLAEPAR